MNQLLAIIALLGMSLVAVPTSAHTLVRDGTIGAVLHIAPNDDPRAGDAATVGFSVSDTNREFSARTCDCQLIILKAGQTLSTVSLPESLETKYTFPETGLYTVRLVGTTNNDTFTIDQSVRVTQVGGSQLWPLGRVLSALFLSVALIATFVLMLRYHRKFAHHMNSLSAKGVHK